MLRAEGAGRWQPASVLGIRIVNDPADAGVRIGEARIERGQRIVRRVVIGRDVVRHLRHQLPVGPVIDQFILAGRFHRSDIGRIERLRGGVLLDDDGAAAVHRERRRDARIRQIIGAGLPMDHVATDRREGRRGRAGIRRAAGRSCGRGAEPGQADLMAGKAGDVGCRQRRRGCGGKRPA